MTRTASDLLVDRLHEWGVRRIYGYPGDGIEGILEARARAQERTHVVQTRHEELAAWKACAHAKSPGRRRRARPAAMRFDGCPEPIDGLLVPTGRARATACASCARRRTAVPRERGSRPARTGRGTCTARGDCAGRNPRRTRR